MKISLVRAINNESCELVILKGATFVLVETSQHCHQVLALTSYLELCHEGGQLFESEDAVRVAIKFIEQLPELVFFLVSVGDGNQPLSEQFDQLADLVLEILRLIVLGEAPSLLHHDDKVVVGRSRHGQVSVVVDPFGIFDFTVSVSAQSVELVQESLEDLVFGGGSANEIGGLAHVVAVGDVANAQLLGAVLVHDVEGAVDHGHFAAGEGVAETGDELLVADVAVLVHVVERHEALYVNFLGEEARGEQRLQKY